MLTPYDWQEGIGHRAQYIEAKLALGAPVAAISLDEGILIATFRRQTRKLFEIYDRLAFAAIGQQSDIEAVRVAALDFASREGYQRSEADVTVHRVATGMSQPVKRAFGDFGQTPLVMRAIFTEVNESPDQDLYYRLDYTGDYSVSKLFTAVAGTDEAEKKLTEHLAQIDRSQPANQVQEGLLKALREAMESDEDETPDDLEPEALLIERSDVRQNRFRLLTPGP